MIILFTNPETANFILNLLTFERLGNIEINTIRISKTVALIIPGIPNLYLENNLLYN